MNKAAIKIAGESGWAPGGRRLRGCDVARVSRSGRVVTLRHAWPEDTDARVWSAVRSAAIGLAHEQSRKTGRAVEVYASGGWMIEQIDAAR